MAAFRVPARQPPNIENLLMYQRIFGLVLLVASVALSITAWNYQAPFSYEPVGPRAYPVLLLALIGLGAVYLLLKPATASALSAEPPMDRHVLRKVAGCVLVLVIYATLFEPLGFIPASVLFGIAMARLYDGSWRTSLITGTAIAIGLYLLFDKVLDVPLPLGILSALEN